MIGPRSVFGNTGVYLENVGPILYSHNPFYPGRQKARHFFIFEVYKIAVEEFKIKLNCTISVVSLIICLLGFKEA